MSASTAIGITKVFIVAGTGLVGIYSTIGPQNVIQDFCVEKTRQAIDLFKANTASDQSHSAEPR